MKPQSKYDPIRQTSPLEACSGILGGKYKCYILWRLLQEGALRYSHLRRLVPCATPKVLTEQLKELEIDGLLVRTVLSDKPKHVVYDLTDEGRRFEPLLMNMWERGKTLLARRKTQDINQPKAQ